MFQEKRKLNRVGTHIVTEIGIDGEFIKYCGYIENISEDGIGIISLDSFKPGEKIDARFYLSSLAGKVNSKVSLVHSQKGDYNLNYYGFKFESLTDHDRQNIAKFISENNMTQSA